jgi:predicted nucleic acid-binding Zn ribbon protein
MEVPIYTFENTDTGEQFDMMMKIADKETWLKKNPNMKQRITKAPSLSYDSVGLGVRKTDDNFNSLLKHIKKGNSKGYTESTIKTR